MLAVIKTLVLPPASLLLLGCLGLVLRRKHRRLGSRILAASLVLLYLLSIPVVADRALGALEPPYADPLQRSEAQAIVALGGGTAGHALEYGADTLNSMTLVRTRYAARLHRLTGKPLLVSGGSVSGKTSPEAEQMRTVLVDEFKVPVRWLETQSRDTLANARDSYRVLAPQGVTTVYLVTHAWHIPRARLAFESAGFAVIPAPTGFRSVDPDGGGLSILDFLPRASAMLNSYYFCHEVLGYMVYWLRVRL